MKAGMLAAALMAVALSGPAFGGDGEFDRLVKAIESHYGAEPTHIPFLGVANFVLKVAHPEGTSGFRLAVFQDIKGLNSPGEPNGWRERDRFMDTIPGRNLHPLVRVHSRHEGNATYIFMGAEGKSSKSTQVLIATFGRDRATVVEVKANIEALLRSLQDPEHAGRDLGGDR
jgi:hypothetical protein